MFWVVLSPILDRYDLKKKIKKITVFNAGTILYRIHAASGFISCSKREAYGFCLVISV